MKNLIIIRHAKSDSAIHLNDVDRPINQRGIEDAKLVATNFLNLIPEKFVIHCSTAKRTKETAIIFANTILYPVSSIIYYDNLYTFDENSLEKVIKSCNNDVDNVILFGHNNAITNFVNKFGDIYIDNVPTAGLIWLQFHTDYWNELKQGKIKKTIFPRNLK
jgi:phosphohistidine phosphatase